MGEKREKKDSGEKKIRKYFNFISKLLVSTAVGFLFGLFVVLLMERFSLFKKMQEINFTFLSALIYIMLALFININIHELGHLVFGKLAGYKLISYRFSIFTWNNENGKMKLSLQFNQAYSGLCAMIPQKKGTAKIADLLFYAGGIIFEMLFSIIFLIAFLYTEGFWAALFFFTAIIGFVTGIINLIPFQSANIPSDGKIIWSFLFNRSVADELIELSDLGSQLVAGVPPAELKVSLAATTEELDSNDLSFVYLAYLKALDEDDQDTYQEAARILEENIALYPSYSLPGIYYEICFTACISGDEEKAREYYQKVRKTLEKDRDINGFRVKAYYEYYINKDREKVLACAQSGLAVKDKYPLKGQAILEEKLIKKLLAKLEVE
ncbi:MAG TPA: M50 family metallopeptidase [Halanaerobiaceae bacterium]|jgi:tetratricopeptide (TPR) repeat protein|nr:M50 family metallopeptidase [Halanaerobiaceae bacterium]